MSNYNISAFIKLVRQMDRSVRNEFNLSLFGTQIQLLETLYRNGPLRMSDLAEKLDITLGAVTSLSDRMIKTTKFIERQRCDDDRRVVRLALSEEGRSFVDSFIKKRSKTKHKFFDKLSEDEIAEFLRLSQKMLD
ncbi:DNA-binding MarR family transcriptional regulator [Scopulibacillus daqui]|uniref:DNA-binding MarR family transcriptional regulator n=1 Tax=Scopulibacillus daqui TaxID=1469162 RepID=A0ABS2Q0C2_9BACL|nr:MarR family transcriptional regulator [Scopulibacillus daqui]MBM7645753.1 DNA-binding MarR family transcriptional regulator [Scopulibacillus daqui]